jgi:hypothetical protein
MATMKYAWSARRWCGYFRRQQGHRLRIPWERGAELTESERELLASSLPEFQQGEGLEGSSFFRSVACYGERSGESGYVEAHSLFMAEEKRHASDLARFLNLAEIPLLTRWSLLNRMFCWLGSRGGLETTLTIIFMVEVIAECYYRALKEATGSAVLRRLCDQIVRDEKSHVRFQAERLAIMRRGRPRWRLCLRHWLDLVFFSAAGAVCWCGHHRVLRAGGHGFFTYWVLAWRRCKAAKSVMNDRAAGRCNLRASKSPRPDLQQLL